MKKKFFAKLLAGPLLGRLLLVALLFCSSFGGNFWQPLYPAIYRAFDVMRGGASHNAAGATGVSNADSFAAITQNPAALVEQNGRSFAFGFDAQTLISAIESKVNLELQYFPLVAFSQPLGLNQHLALAIHSPFQRRLVGDNFFQYDIDFSYAHSLGRHFSWSVTLGPAFALQVGGRNSDLYAGWGYSGGLGMFYRGENFSLGAHYAYSAKLRYRPFADGRSLDEKMPDIVKAGYTRYFYNRVLRIFSWRAKVKELSLSFEVDSVLWPLSSFVSAELERAINFSWGWQSFNPHAGFHVEFEDFLRGLWFNGGFFTEDHYDFSGNNKKQVLATIGFGGYATRNEWGNSLKIEFSLISSFLPSYIFHDNHQIEKFQITFEISL